MIASALFYVLCAFDVWKHSVTSNPADKKEIGKIIFVLGGKSIDMLM